MRASIRRVTAVAVFGFACVLVGFYLGFNQAYDRIVEDLPALIQEAGCVDSGDELAIYTRTDLAL